MQCNAVCHSTAAVESEHANCLDWDQLSVSSIATPEKTGVQGSLQIGCDRADEPRGSLAGQASPRGVSVFANLRSARYSNTVRPGGAMCKPCTPLNIISKGQCCLPRPHTFEVPVIFT